jgi:hypothetical protein
MPSNETKPPFDKTDAPAGYVAIEVNVHKCYNAYHNCAFRGSVEECEAAHCGPSDRKDGRTCIFVREE